MTPFQQRVGVPALAAVIMAASLMAVDNAFGPPPIVLPFRYGAVVVHIAWLAGLLVIGAVAPFMARRVGASLAQQVIVAISPALVIGGAVNVLMAVVVTTAHLGGHRVHPVDFIGHFIVGWLVLPAGALLIGALPCLRDPSSAQEGGGQRNQTSG